jgi:serine/threonine protein phosphatase PrpC
MPFWKRWQSAPEQPPEPEPRQGIAFGLARDIGQVRNINQDQILALQTSLPAASRQLQIGLFIVADGMGGHTGGDIASALAVQVVAAEVLQHLLLPVLQGGQPEVIQDVLKDAVMAANRAILEEAARRGSDMGTTVTTGLLVENHLYVAHVGDSRLYTYDETGLKCHTRDHSMVARLMELGQITPEEAQHHPKRNYLYQSVGQQDDIEVEFDSFSLEDCRYFLLCSDGLWGVVGEEILNKTLNEGGEPQAICNRLVEQANEAGGEDNIAVIVVALPE